MTKLEALCRKHKITMVEYRKKNGELCPEFHRDIATLLLVYGEKRPGIVERVLQITDYEIYGGFSCADILDKILERCIALETAEEFSSSVFPTSANYHMWMDYTKQIHVFLGDEYNQFVCAPHKE